MPWPTALPWEMAAIVLAAYCVFGLTGFGSALVAVPVLAQFMPLRSAVPLILLMDLLSTVVLGARNWRSIARPELALLLPFMGLGIAVGVIVLKGAPATPLLVLLGTFVIANSAWNLLAKGPRGTVRRGWVAPAGFIGGIFSALFGTGGPVYVSYLAGRIHDAAALRATIASVILASAVIRLFAFASAGLYTRELLVNAAMLLPFCAVGVWVGSRLHRGVRVDVARRILYVLLALSGASVLVRALSAG